MSYEAMQRDLAASYQILVGGFLLVLTVAFLAAAGPLVGLLFLPALLLLPVPTLLLLRDLADADEIHVATLALLGATVVTAVFLLRSGVAMRRERGGPDRATDGTRSLSAVLLLPVSMAAWPLGPIAVLAGWAREPGHGRSWFPAIAAILATTVWMPAAGLFFPVSPINLAEHLVAVAVASAVAAAAAYLAADRALAWARARRSGSDVAARPDPPER